MCLSTLQKKPKIAEKDIICYKIMYPLNNGIYRSIYYQMNYKLNTLYKTSMKRSLLTNCYDFKASVDTDNYPKKSVRYIGQGFHSAKTRKRLGDIWDSARLLKCIIPKGAKYYEGISDLLVSDQIILMREVKLRKKSV